MLKLLVIADDFTGALDAGVQLAKRGIATAVYSGQVSLEQMAADIQVAVVNTESRHLSPEEAYQSVKTLEADARKNGVSHCYKKVDSTLRGNIGSELEAAIDGFGEDNLFFAPAFPKIGRTTRGGVQFFNGVPIAETVFGKDPFEPVTCSEVSGIIAAQSKVPVHLVGANEPVPEREGPRVLLFDCESDEDFTRYMPTFGQGRLMAGSAGFAEYLPALIHFETEARTEISIPGKAVFVSGSVNPITLRQVEAAQEQGLPVFWLTEPEKFDAAYVESAEGRAFLQKIETALRERQVAVLSINGRGEEAPGIEETHRRLVGRNLGCLVERLLEGQRDYTLVVFGGDTAMEILGRLGGGVIRPVREINPGVVLSKAMDRNGTPFLFVTKSGGFGQEDEVRQILEYLWDGKAQQPKEVLSC